ncbi:MAG: magnesium chelatase [Firmicutes bacterium HGW-Firmicutes-15]|nr:MAG: magnesium chelatase [Firmicutes bacterium HGW-Firmicutes-15]
MDSGQSNIGNATSVANYLSLYLGQDQGVRLGESVVVSRKAHARMPAKKIKGQIEILINCDAGKTYLDCMDIDQIVHIDVYHLPGEIDPRVVARAIFWAMEEYFVNEDPQLQYADDVRFEFLSGYAEKIQITTNLGKGLIYDLFQNELKPYTVGEEGHDHVHILARLNRDEYALVYIIAATVEEVILKSGLQLARVRNISHGKQKKMEDDFAKYIKLPWKKFKGQTASFMSPEENVNQLVLKLAEKFGGIEEIEEWMQCYSSNIFKRKGAEYQKKKWGDVDHYVKQLEELDLIQKTPLGRILTKKGLVLQEYVIKHKCELETEIRRNIRKVPGGGSTRFRKFGKSKQKTTHVEFVDYNKTINKGDTTWTGNLAVSQTVIQAVKNGFLRGDEHFSIKKEDLHFYGKKSYIPIDICLLMDASGSMAGEKRQAACYLAQHLLLTGKERVAVVTFQEHSARVVSPFTRSQSVLSKGLATINPGGLTPMASGIMMALDLIKKSRVHNPLLIMITDGIPNAPLWTLDAKGDALAAVANLPAQKIRFICIGVESNAIYMEKLSKSGEGALYLVDDLNKENLINLVRYEKKGIIKE